MVEICAKNVINRLDVEQILESEYPEVSVLKNECLSLCGLCNIKPFAFVNGQRIFANTTEECLHKIKKRIEAELEIYTAE